MIEYRILCRKHDGTKDLLPDMFSNYDRPFWAPSKELAEVIARKFLIDGSWEIVEHEVPDEPSEMISEDDLLKLLRDEGTPITRRQLKRYIKAGLIPAPTVFCGMRPGKACLDPDKCNPNHCHYPDAMTH